MAIVKIVDIETTITKLAYTTLESKKDAIELLKLCTGDIIKKTRYLIKEKNGLNFEVDVFEENNKGLIIAEIELEYETQEFVKPNWLDVEVTANKKSFT